MELDNKVVKLIVSCIDVRRIHFILKEIFHRTNTISGKLVIRISREFLLFLKNFGF